MEAALKVFSEKGYELSSMDEIAKVADASKRTVYNHFLTKDALFMTVASNLIEMSDEFKEITYSPTINLREQLGHFIEAELKILKNPLWLKFIKAIFDYVNRQPALAKQLFERKCKRDDIFLTWLKAAEDDGKIHVPNPRVTSDIFWNTINGNFTYIAMGNGFFDQEQANQIKPEIIDLFLCKYAITQ